MDNNKFKVGVWILPANGQIYSRVPVVSENVYCGCDKESDKECYSTKSSRL